MRILMLQPNTEQNIQIKLCNGVTINTHYWKIVDKFLDKSKICWALSNVDSSACPIIFTLGPNHKYQGEGSKLRLIQHLWKALWHQTENSIAPIKNIARGLKSLKLAAQTTMSYKKGIINIVKEVESKHLPYRKINCTCREKYDFNGPFGWMFCSAGKSFDHGFTRCFSDTDKYLTRLLYRWNHLA